MPVERLVFGGEKAGPRTRREHAPAGPDVGTPAGWNGFEATCLLFGGPHSLPGSSPVGTRRVGSAPGILLGAKTQDSWLQQSMHSHTYTSRWDTHSQEV